MTLIQDLMTREVLTVSTDDTVEQAVALILQHCISGLPVVDGQDRLVGIVTEFALLDMLFQPELRTKRVDSVMSRELITVAEDATPKLAAQLLVRHRVRRIPVVRAGKLVGVVSRRDLIRFATLGFENRPLVELIEQSPQKAAPRSRLLVVDDSQMIRELVRDALQPLRYELTFVTRAEGSLELARQGSFDLVLLDRVLPDIDGLEVLRQLRADPATQHVPVIMVTSCDLPAHVAEAIDAGAVDYIRKPFSPTEIRARVQAALRSSRLQRELWKAKSDAESASRSKSEFLANMSHEIRTPMTAILGYAEVLRDHLTDPLHLQAVETIHRNGEHLLEVINDILDIARIESGREEIERTEVSPAAIVQEVAQLMQVRAQAKNIQLEIEFAGAIPKTILTDAKRLRQILINLVGNAVKFTDRGSVKIVAGLSDAAAGHARLEVEVIDTGIGISPLMIERVFEPFAQADTSSSRAYGGTGLGLAICKALAETLGGGIRVRSQPGKGSTFTLTIEAGPAASLEFVKPQEADRRTTPVSQSETTAVPLAGCRVLLAEDGPDNQRLITLLLKKAGAEVDVAENGQVALEWASARPDTFDVVLMDMQMPVLDGYEATRRLRAAGFERPIIAVTAHAMSGDREKCLAAGCNDFVSKPIERKSLIETVGLYHRRRLQLAAAACDER